MSITIAALMDEVAFESHRSNIYAGDGTTLDTTQDDYKDVLRWVKMAIRTVQDIGDWQCHKATFTLSTSTTPALAAGTYAYDLPTLLSDFRKIQADSVRYSNTMLTWVDSIEELDRQISNGPKWKDSGSDNGTPKFATLMGNDLIIAPKPSAAHIAASSSITGYYYKSEALSSTSAALLFSDGFFVPLVECAMLFANRQEDAVEWRTALEQWNRVNLPLLRGLDLAPSSDEEIIAGDELIFGIEGRTAW